MAHSSAFDRSELDHEALAGELGEEPQVHHPHLAGPFHGDPAGARDVKGIGEKGTDALGLYSCAQVIKPYVDEYTAKLASGLDQASGGAGCATPKEEGSSTLDKLGCAFGAATKVPVP